MSTTATPTVPLPDRSDRFADAMARVTAALGGRLAFGGDYNPEQWPEDVWAVRRRADEGGRGQPGLAGDLLLGVARAEGRAGTSSAGWTRFSGCCTRAGSRSTWPTPRPRRRRGSPWRYPESLPVDVDGVRRSYGGRQAFCPSSPDYRAAAAALTAADRRAVRRPPGGGDVARAQRVRLPQLELLLRRLGDGVPQLAAAPLRRARDAERRLGHGVLEPALLRLGRGHPAAAAGLQHLRQPHPAARLRPVQLRRTARLLPRRGRDHPGRREPAGDHQLHGLLQAAGLLVAGRRRWTWSPTTTTGSVTSATPVPRTTSRCRPT